MRAGAWSPEADAELVRLRAEGTPPKEIARQLGRTQQAVNLRAHKLQLPRPAVLRRERPEERFWAKVDRRGPDECWEWQGAVFWNGYGCFDLDGRSVKAHRYAFELLVEAIPESMRLMHSCDNPPCVNPAHLSVGTQRENTHDMISKARKALGEQTGRARLTTEQVTEIKGRLAIGETQSALAREFGVASVTVHWIAVGKTWKEVTAWKSG